MDWLGSFERYNIVGTPTLPHPHPPSSLIKGGAGGGGGGGREDLPKIESLGGFKIFC